MTSIKVKFRPSAVSGKMGRIYYQILHDRSPRQLLTDYRIHADEWDAIRETVKLDAGDDRIRDLRNIYEEIDRDVERLRRITVAFKHEGAEFRTEDIINRFRQTTLDNTLFKFMERIIDRLRKDERLRTSETYTSALRSFRHFRTGEDIPFDLVTSEVMEEYESWLKGRGLVPNTISFYTRILRAVYNRAVEEGLTDNRYPFRRVYTGIDKTTKRAVSLSTIKLIHGLDLTSRPQLEYARDLFILSFMLRGMAFIDMAMLKKTDLHYGNIIYRRRKTGQLIHIRWTRDMQRILDKYPPNESDYLLPIIRRSDIDARRAYHNIGNLINQQLKIVASMVGLKIPLTLYVARHSWATAAQAKGIPLGIISEGMGHNSESTTRIYLAGIASSEVDKANDKILRSIL